MPQGLRLTHVGSAPRILEMNLRKQLLLLLEQRELSAAELSRKSGVPKQTISGWLSGQKPKDIDQLKKVADVLCVSLDHLCFGVGPEKNSGQFTDMGNLVGEDWIGGLFEVRLRRVKRPGGEK